MDIEPFKKIDLLSFDNLKKSKVIALGEMAHGSGGLHQVAGQVIKSAIFDLGTRLFGLEAPVGIVEDINSNIASKNSHPLTKQNLSNLYPIWRTQEMFELLNWMHEFNLRSHSPENEIQVIGFDVRLPFFEIREVLKWTKQNGGTSPPLASIGELDVPKLRAVEMSASLGQTKEVEFLFAGVEESIDELESRIKLPSRIQFLLRRIRAWSRVYRCWAQDGRMESGYLERDRQMFQLLTEQLDSLNSPNPVVLLAHLNHLLRHNLEVEQAKSHVVAGPLLGNHLARKFGKDLSVVGLFAAKIELFDSQNSPELFVADQNSFESRLHASIEERAIVDVRHLPVSLQGRTRIGDVNPRNRPQLSTYSDFYFVPSRQIDYAVVAGLAATRDPF